MAGIAWHLEADHIANIGPADLIASYPNRHALFVGHVDREIAPVE